jgi:hypothetical protein
MATIGMLTTTAMMVNMAIIVFLLRVSAFRRSVCRPVERLT